METIIEDIKKCFSFDVSDEYPSGYVSISKENVEKLSLYGWKINFHTDYYMNHISGEYKNISVGFCAWRDSLDAFIEYGEYSERIQIKSREQLDVFITLVDCIVKMSNFK